MEINWLELWRDLVNATTARTGGKEGAKRYEVRSRQKTAERPDQLLDFIVQNIDSQDTVLDVGAGNGRWAIPLAKRVRSVTAIEPSDSIGNMLRENIASAKLDNIQIVKARWEEAIVEKHGVVVCAHAIYASQDFAGFVRKMEQHAKKRCNLAVRLPPHDGIIGELCLSIYGHRHDSPDAIIAYNALYSMGIYANVLVEEGIYRWVDSTLDDAFARAKRHLRLGSSAAYDGLIRDTLARRLARVNNSYVWPDGMRSVLLWWTPALVSK